MPNALVVLKHFVAQCKADRNGRRADRAYWRPSAPEASTHSPLPTLVGRSDGRRPRPGDAGGYTPICFTAGERTGAARPGVLFEPGGRWSPAPSVAFYSSPIELVSSSIVGVSASEGCLRTSGVISSRAHPRRMREWIHADSLAGIVQIRGEMHWCGTDPRVSLRTTARRSPSRSPRHGRVGGGDAADL